MFPTLRTATRRVLLMALLLGGATSIQAGPLRDRLQAHRAAASAERDLDADGPSTPLRLPKQAQVIRDVRYGADKRQRFDVYRPRDAKDAPVIFMVHGGAWRTGDKAMNHVVQNKVTRWVSQGFIVISANYRLLPDVDPLEQAWDVGQALSTAQGKAASWGGDRRKFILMGHSAGAHLVALINASPVLATGLGATPWLGTVSLDSAALNVVSTMEASHPRLYDRAFGMDPGFWQVASPWHQMSKGSAPLLVVCSSRRADSCPQGEKYRDKAATLGARVGVLAQDLSHGDINSALGEPSAYTRAVEQFMSSLDSDVARRLKR